MNHDIKQKWVAALRSGKFRQARSRLREYNDTCCCLGVLCEVLELPRTFEGYTHGDDHLRYYLTKSLCDGIGLPYGAPEKEGDDFSHKSQDDLMEMNDEGKTFAEIADFIEKEF